MAKSDVVSRAVDRKQQALKIARGLEANYRVALCALHHANPFELLAATILSAQCTDERVNMVTPGLFAKYPTPAKLAAAAQADVEKIVQSTGFFRAKSANLIGMAQGLMRMTSHSGIRLDLDVSAPLRKARRPEPTFRTT